MSQPRRLDTRLVFSAIAVGLLCSLAGIYQALTGSPTIGAALVLTALVIGGFVWHHLLGVRRDRLRG